MHKLVEDHIATVLNHVYINPLEKCNLACKICYTRKSDPILTHTEILDFIDRFRAYHAIQTITFCGGEVFALSYFPALVNECVRLGIFVQIITNGTIDKLSEFENPNSVNLIVSLDGLEAYHDQNRGEGNFKKSVSFLKKADAMGFHTEIFSIITRQNLSDIDSFESHMNELIPHIAVTYHPRKPPSYLAHHPVSNIYGAVDGFDFLSDEEMIQVLKTRSVFPPKYLGCYQIAVASDGKVYGCCEGITSIGTITTEVSELVGALRARITQWELNNTLKHCLGCSEPEFMCGIKQYLSTINSDL